MGELNFSDDKYKTIALNINQLNENIHSYEEAFFVLIKGLNIKDLDNLCRAIQKHYLSFSNTINLSLEDCYKLIQSDNLNDIEKSTIVKIAEECIKSGINLGSNTVNDNKINTSSWISHSFYSSEVCSKLATHLGLDSNKAKTLGLLHDYGRKFNHSFNHVIDGFENLCNIGWETEAVGCLTHSFVNGGRCSNNEAAVEGFYVDDYGNAKWKDGTNKDDMTIFLENYKYSDYDILLNISDLMATDKEIMSPKDRINDIATRRILDPTNRSYFLADITNVYINMLKKFNLLDNNFNYIKADKNTSFEQIYNYFTAVSNYFYQVFLSFPEEKKQNII